MAVVAVVEVDLRREPLAVEVEAVAEVALVERLQRFLLLWRSFLEARTL